VQDGEVLEPPRLVDALGDEGHRPAVPLELPRDDLYLGNNANRQCSVANGFARGDQRRSLNSLVIKPRAGA
jgi:hypothetical protein